MVISAVFETTKPQFRYSVSMKTLVKVRTNSVTLKLVESYFSFISFDSVFFYSMFSARSKFGRIWRHPHLLSLTHFFYVNVNISPRKYQPNIIFGNGKAQPFPPPPIFSLFFPCKKLLHLNWNWRCINICCTFFCGSWMLVEIQLVLSDISYRMTEI